MHWYTDVIRRYAEFAGRSDRPEFWWFALWNVVISLVIWGIGYAAGGFGLAEGLASIYGLITLLPALGVEIRRLHDTDRTGWWVLIGFIPLIGGIILIVLFAGAGTAGPNRYGTEPPPRTA